jgi:hypothetical protein
VATTLYCTFDDVTAAFEGTIPSTDRARVESLIKRASARLTHMMPSIVPRIQSGDLDPELPAGLVIESVLRVYRNPEGITAEEVGPFHKQFNPRSIVAEISFDDEEVQEVLAPIPNYLRPSIRVGMPVPSQVLAEVDGVQWPPIPQTVDDALPLTDSVSYVYT